MKIDVVRNAEHPWGDRQGGFDQMQIQAKTETELNLAIKSAEQKFWQCWISGVDDSTGTPTAIMYKPCGVQSSWHDSPEHPHPGSIIEAETGEEKANGLRQR